VSLPVAVAGSSELWSGTDLPLLSLEQAMVDASSSTVTTTWSMGRWPDPILRRTATDVDVEWMDDNLRMLHAATRMLAQTAVANRAVGLAAQQCGVDARMVYVRGDDNGTTRTGRGSRVLINPRITRRSPEVEQQTWNEECLVLPPQFRATVSRDAWIDVDHYCVTHHHDDDDDPATLSLRRHTTRFHDEQARCLQHELDHDRGILIVDHVPLEELPTRVMAQDTHHRPTTWNMREMESKGHDQRMDRAFHRYLDA
jgi:peptide deformylase